MRHEKPEAVSFGRAISDVDGTRHTRNDYGSDLRPGSLAVVVEVDPGKGLACDFDGVRHVFGPRGLADLGLAYALSCHRFQGSHARVVVVSLADAAMLDPNWLYNAITSAEETVVLVGTGGILEQAAERPPAFERRITGYRFDLEGA